MVSINLGRLMPNVGGPDMKARRLHAEVLNSVAMYGAPVWAESLAASRPMQARLRRVQRGLAVRVARCYRTVSCVVATVLASMPPMELVALSYKRMYDRKRELLRTGGADVPLARTIREMKHQTRRILLERWQRYLANARYGRRTVEAVRPFLLEWVGRAHGALTFRAAQVLTGHGCFDESIFTNHGGVNRHNMHYWSVENPHWLRQVEHQRPWNYHHYLMMLPWTFDKCLLTGNISRFAAETVSVVI
ncbi:uncharacterized protein LOC112590689 [Harpegnathos saltator]|uniref:uncharacterized protein LOC112590689 n=1 Tax=Harpegnathos saltator TaxID=610380 RepID=UPI000DBEED6C|nr:uncharacterized protein LOC112590689 [Harpegnathos saltator]